MPRRTHPKSEAVPAADSGSHSITVALLLVELGLVCALVAVTLFFVASAGGGSGDDECTWGASSIIYEDGRIVSGPDVTGCVP
jgi:hypothetical protein